jgi:hypothetical protein
MWILGIKHLAEDGESDGQYNANYGTTRDISPATYLRRVRQRDQTVTG